MVVIAVAGGTGGVGKTIVEQLQQESKYDVVVLTRSARNPSQDTESLKYVQINYDDVPSMVEVLENHDVQTVISAITLISDETSQSQLNLIEAAREAKVARFLPSEYGLVNTPELLKIDPSVKWWLDAADLLKRTNMKFTRFVPGWFMDYWGMPYVKTNLRPFHWVIDMVNCKAAIPGDGEDLVTLTYSVDMARFMVKALDLDEWPEFSIVGGDDISLNQFLKLAEEIRGSKFDVTYDTAEQIERGEVTLLSTPTDPSSV